MSKTLLISRLITKQCQSAYLNAFYCRRNLYGRRRPKPDHNTRALFGEVDRRGGYPRPFQDSLTAQDRLNIYKQALLKMPESYAQLRDYFLYDRIGFKPRDVRHGDYYYINHLSRDGGHSNWVVTADSHYGEGYSIGEFVPSSLPAAAPVKDENSDDQQIIRSSGVFRGYLDTRVPQTGQLVRAGYVNLRSPYALMIMGRPRSINLQPLNCIVIRYRGDGRTYRLNLHRSPLTRLDFDLFDMYTFPLYTRGGPYWTVSKIPASKLIRNYKGRIQDRPVLNRLDNYAYLSITLADGIRGPFSLELDYVAAFYDAHLNEEFAYEIYPVSSLMKKNIM